MKKINFLLMLGLMSAASMQAQTTIASLGFESSDAKGKASAYALTPGLSAFGDWVNVKDDDQWDEQYREDVHSGEYALYADNAGTAGQSWDRGFKIAQLPIKENTPYRVSFWVKADPTYIDSDDNNVKNTCLTSWLSQGIENFDKSINSPSGYNYGVQMTSGLTGEWQFISYVSYYTNSETLNNIIKDQSWVGNAVYPEEFGGDGTQTYSEYYGGKLPEEFFLIINMYSPNVAYTLDDIKVEEGVTFNAAYFSPQDYVIKLDFGYQTNIATLAAANEGSIVLDNSCVKVTVNGKEAPIDCVEGQKDGFLYIFLADEAVVNDEDDVRITFTPSEDCPIIYPTDRRPSSDTESEMKVLGFSNEKAYLVSSIDAIPSSWSPAKMVSSVPENESFEIDAATFNNIAVTFNKKVKIDNASASLMRNGVHTDLTNGMSLSANGLTVNTAVSNLADGEYTFILSGVTNEMGFECDGDQEIVFAVGEDHEGGSSELVYSTNETFAETANGTFPVGWVANDNGTIHQYGLTDGGEVWNYNWGANVGGGGCRAMTGYSGDLNGAAIYWRSMNGSNSLGTLTYGEQVKDYLLPGGAIDPEMPEGISLKLEAVKHQITIRMCAWKNLNGNTEAVNEENAPKYSFTLEDLDGNVYARFDDVIAMPNVNGAQNISVTGVTRSQTDFTVDKAGYYMLKFSTTQPNGEYLLGGVDLITMPSKAAYWKQQLAAAVENAEPIMDLASDVLYNGDTKTAFAAAINNAKTGHFTSPSEITALINQLKELGTQMQARVDNIDQFINSIASAADAVALLDGKYATSPYATEAQALVEQYAGTDPSTLSDAELAEAAPKLANASALMGNVKEMVDILTWRAYKAAQTAETLGVEGSAKDAAYGVVDDNDEVVDACNQASKLALYKWFAAGAQAPGVNPEIDETMKTEVPYDGAQIYMDGAYTETNADMIATNGIDFTCLVKNPRFYTFTTNGSAALQDNTVVGWNCTQYEGGSVHLASGASATAEKPVITSAINAYGSGAEYKFYQVIEDAPVGVYDVYFASRTAIKNNPDGDGVRGVFNAMDDETGIWDKYIFAQVDDEEPIMVPFSAGSSWFGHPTVIPNVTVKKGQKLTIGAVEHYISGKASGHNFDEELGAYTPTDYWDTNTFVGEARMFLVAPVQGFDYAAEAEELADAIELVNAEAGRKIVGIFSVSGTQVPSLQKGLNIVKFDNGNVRKVYIK